MTAHRMYYLPLGVLEIDQKRLPLGVRSENQWVPTPIGAYLVQTDNGMNILFDTGCDPDGLKEPERVWGRLAKVMRIHMGPEDDLHSRLASVGLTPDDITHVVASHLHFDHAGGLRFFRNAEILIQRMEYRFALLPDEGQGGFYRSDFDHPHLRWRFLDGDEVLTDGVTLVLSNGHTPGLQSMVVDLPETGTVVVTSDACYFQQHLERNTPAPGAWNPRLAFEAIKRLKAIAQRSGGTVFCGHDADQISGLKKAPLFYS